MSIIYTIILTLLLLFSLKNIVVYLMTKDKTFLSMFFILVILIFMIFVNRYLLGILNNFDNVHNVLDIINVTLISGGVVYFSNYFLHLKTINQLTIYYYYFIFLIAFLFVCIILLFDNSLFFSSLHHLVVFFYCIILIAVIISEAVKNKSSLYFNKVVRIITFFVMMVSFIGMTIYKILLLPMNPIFYLGIFVMILFMEFELVFKVKIQEVDDLLEYKLNNIDEKDRELIKYIINGLEYKEIAKRTGKTLNTVRKYIHLLYQKYDVCNKTELINKILKD